MVHFLTLESLNLSPNMRKDRVAKKSIYILTEGHTEQAYFSRIGEILGEDVDGIYSVKVEVREIVKGSKQDPVNIVKEAKRSKKDYNEIWVVFDKDRERDGENQAALLLANKSKINVAFSSISFEHWLILHFEKNSFAFERSDCESRSKEPPCVCNGTICASTYLKKPNLYPAFSKGYSLLYDEFKHRNNIAIENAAWLRFHQRPYTSIATLNPYSDVDILLSELLRIERVYYLGLTEVFHFDEVEISVLSWSRVNNDVFLEMHIHNIGNTAFLVNNNQKFVAIDDLENTIAYNTVASSILNPDSHTNITLGFTVNPTVNSLRFKATSFNKHFFVELF